MTSTFTLEEDRAVVLAATATTTTQGMETLEATFPDRGKRATACQQADRMRSRMAESTRPYQPTVIHLVDEQPGRHLVTATEAATAEPIRVTEILYPGSDAA